MLTYFTPETNFPVFYGLKLQDYPPLHSKINSDSKSTPPKYIEKQKQNLF